MTVNSDHQPWYIYYVLDARNGGTSERSNREGDGKTWNGTAATEFRTFDRIPHNIPSRCIWNGTSNVFHNSMILKLLIIVAWFYSLPNVGIVLCSFI